MESLFPKQKSGVTSIFQKISDSTRKTYATNVGHLKTNTITVMVKGKKIEFNRKDRLFELTGPVAPCSTPGCEVCEVPEK